MFAISLPVFLKQAIFSFLIVNLQIYENVDKSDYVHSHKKLIFNNEIGSNLNANFVTEVLCLLQNT